MAKKKSTFKKQGHNTKKERTGKKTTAVQTHDFKIGEIVFGGSWSVVEKNGVRGTAYAAWEVIGISPDKIHIRWAKGLGGEWVDPKWYRRDDFFRPTGHKYTPEELKWIWREE